MTLDPRAPRPDARFDLTTALLVAAAVALVYVAALYTDLSPPRGLAVALVGATPLLAVLALLVLRSRAAAERDPALAWVSGGLAVAVAALTLQFLSFPTIAADGGPFGTSSSSNSGLYLTFHLALALFAVLGAFEAPSRWHRPALAAGLVLVVALVLDLVPLPVLVDEAGRFTVVLTVVEVVLGLGTVAATVVWARRVGRTPRALHGWVGLALFLTACELFLNAATAARFDPAWWASLSLRIATYGVLAVGSVITVLRELVRYERYSERELDRREGQLRESLDRTEQLLAAATTSATTLQQALLPQDVVTPEEVPTAARYRPASGGEQVGGDWYDAVPLPSGGVALVIGDVEGHDLAAASLMGLVRASVRSYALDGHAPSTVLERVNTFLATTGTDRLVTLAYVEVYPDDRLLTVALAGHPCPLLVPRDGKRPSVLDVEPGLVLGLAPAGRWPEQTLLLPAGSALVLYTDGLVECPATAAEARLDAVLAAAAAASAGSCEDLADALLAEAPEYDDVALLVARLTSEQRPAVERALPVQPMSVPIARTWIRDVLRLWQDAGLLPPAVETGERVDTAQLVLTELVSNALRHSQSPIRLSAGLHGSRVRVEVTDTGHRMPIMRTAGPGETAGRGLLLVDRLTSAWGVEPGEHGKTVWFEIDWTSDGEADVEEDEDALLAAWSDEL